jgi:hypothetical protein
MQFKVLATWKKIGGRIAAKLDFTQVSRNLKTWFFGVFRAHAIGQSQNFEKSATRVVGTVDAVLNHHRTGGRK